MNLQREREREREGGGGMPKIDTPGLAAPRTCQDALLLIFVAYRTFGQCGDIQRENFFKINFATSIDLIPKYCTYAATVFSF